MIPPELNGVPVFDPVLFKMNNGRPVPNIMHHQTRHQNTLREFAVQRAIENNVSNVWAEFGVENGISARYFLSQLPEDGKFHLYDSMKGLPESWEGKPAGHRKAVQLPVFDDMRVYFHIGWFKDTLPLDEVLGFVHIDCDLYSSTKDVFEGIQVTSGTIILFDELFGYEGFENHEYRALREYDHPYTFIGRDSENRAAIEMR